MMGETVAGLFSGHTDSVRSVAFSSDGQHIISGSSDNTICVWDAMMGKTVAGLFSGHTDSVRSVAFLSDGQRIVSGSSDKTIHVWDATTGETVAGPFSGHTDSVWSVAFSPDGQRIVSGSSDNTIRVWDATMGVPDMDITLTDQSIITNNGWICGPERKLLLWIPQPHRTSLHHPSNVWIAGAYTTCLDLSNPVHGKDWTTCHMPR
jgi:WD40 repeat protein